MKQVRRAEYRMATGYTEGCRTLPKKDEWSEGHTIVEGFMSEVEVQNNAWSSDGERKRKHCLCG